ncbi:hypothetical protein F383_01097 [Gossypium arboreum]|uniref:Uncharacterized protein n=1 Tax=Gossypium arboreum TaxID=29729 RepID=A0A0B0NZR4_GOSAR|nr:hypothetical protein F383_01097 [Gossypium arboreum]
MACIASLLHILGKSENRLNHSSDTTKL